MNDLSTLLILYCLDEIMKMQKRQKRAIGKLNMKVNELTNVVTALADQLTKASGEINTQLEVLRNADLPQEAVDAVNRIASVVQALDDLNPDATPVPTDPIPEEQLG